MFRMRVRPGAGGGAALIGRELHADVRRFRRAIRKKLREAGNIVRRKQRDLLRGGTGPSIRKIARTSKSGRTRSGSRLLSQHRVVIRIARDARGRSQEFWEAFVGPTPGGLAFYGKFHEFGTGERRTRAGRSRGALPARPWMKPSIDATVGQVEAKLAESYRKVRIAR